MIELKKSVSRWARTRRKISHVIWRKQSTFDTERTGGSLSIILDKPDWWEIVLTSTMRWPHKTVYTKNLEQQQLRPVPFWKHQKWHQSSSSSSWWQWSDSRWSSWQLKESPQMSLRAKRHDRTERPVVCRLGIKPQTCDFQDLFPLCCCSWIVYSWRRSAATDGRCKDNTLQVHFRSVNLYKEFPYRSESE